MRLASRMPYLTDELLKSTLRAAEVSSCGVDWLTLAEIEHLEQRLLSLRQRTHAAVTTQLADVLVARLEDLGYTVRVERRAA